MAAALVLGASVACSLTTDFDGLSGGIVDAGSRSSNDASLDASPEASAPVCAPGASFDADPKNCGSCGHDCLGALCGGGICQPAVLATGISSEHIHVDGTYAFLADRDGRVARVPKHGGTLTVLTGDQSVLYELGLDDDRVFFGVASSVSSIPKAGGDPTPVVTSNYNAFIQVIGDKLWWAHGIGSGHPNKIERANKDGSNRETIVDNSGDGLETFALDGDLLFYAHNGQGNTGDIRVKTLSTGQDNVVAAAGARRLVIDATNVYFLDYGSGNLWVVPRSGGTPTPLASTDQSTNAADLVIDGEYIYWAVQNDGGGVYRVKRAGGAKEAIAANQNVHGVTTDDGAVYWTVAGSDLVYFRAK